MNGHRPFSRGGGNGSKFPKADATSADASRLKLKVLFVLIQWGAALRCRRGRERPPWG